MADRPTAYGELAELLVKLPSLVRETREQRRLSQRAVARAIGVCPSTMSRFERTGALDLDHLVAVLRWLDQLPPKEASRG
ncbi:helix-turn-helix transcriptional regulator [Amycolatopsis sp. NPDC051128]|uniref:helix-turn-helix domain-containing protein n=1 Tax=Amycolatopsis sp. NPDC051128 TaxID=3155412 RepID=UPI00342ABD1D